MAFGITPTGFVAKRLSDIKAEIEDVIRGTFGSGVNLDARGPFGQLIGVFAERESLLWELAEQTYDSQFPQTADGVGVDNALSLVGLTRKNATKSAVDLKLFGEPGTIIPAGSQISKSDDSTVVFETIQAGTILPNTGTNEVQKIIFSAVPDAGSWQLNFDGQLTTSLAFNISAGQLETELENLSNLTSVTVTGNFTSGFTITFTGVDGQKNQVQLVVSSNSLTSTSNPVTATPSTLTPGVRPNVTVEATCLVFGPVAAPSGSLTVIETPISGWETVSNALDAELGEDLESDADAKQRRNESLAFPGHATVPAILADLLQLDGVVAVRIFENESFVVDPSGRPPKSYETVIQGGDEDEIADVILETKPAGIQTVGSILKNLTDSQGFAKEIRFSRPTEIPIYIILDLTVNALYPPNGDDLVKEALIAYGLTLNIGDDIIVLPKLICAIDEIPGITDIGIIDAVIQIATAPIPAAGTATVTFANVTTDLAVDYTAHGIANLSRVYFTNSGGALPTGLNPNQLYWVRSGTANQFKLSETRTGDLIDFVDAGTGTTTIHKGGFDENILISETERAVFDTSRITVNS